MINLKYTCEQFDRNQIHAWNYQRMKTCRFVIFCVIFIGYLLLGALGFWLTEAKLEDKLRADILNARRLFKDKASCITGLVLSSYF
jgi:hypothetical protein